MDAPKGDGTSENSRRVPGKRAAPRHMEGPTDVAHHPLVNAPCGACKFLRRKCIGGCIFAPHFRSDQGAARFAAVHKVFGASNVSKLLSHIPTGRRHDAVVTISYEAQARLSDPIYGCVSTIIAMQQQVASLQAELAVVQTQLLNSRLVMANVLQSSPPPHRHHDYHHVLQPAYSGTSSASNNHFSMHSFGPSCGETAPSDSFEPVPHLSGRAAPDEEEDEEESHDPVAFADHIFH